MASYPPPSNPGATFNPSDWETTNQSSVTQSELNNYVTLSTAQNVTGLKSFSSGLSTATILNSGHTITVPATTDTLATVSQLPSSSTFMDLSTNQVASG